MNDIYEEKLCRVYNKEAQKTLKKIRSKEKKGKRVNQYNIWIDGSFYDTNYSVPKGMSHFTQRYFAGGAAVVCKKDDIQSVLMNNLNIQDVTSPFEAELFNALVTLQSFPRGTIRMFTCDNFSAVDIMKDIAQKQKFSLPFRVNEETGEKTATISEQTHKRLVRALGRHNNIHVRHVKRSKEYIPIAHRFAQSAALLSDRKANKGIYDTFRSDDALPHFLYAKPGNNIAYVDLPINFASLDG